MRRSWAILGVLLSITGAATTLLDLRADDSRASSRSQNAPYVPGQIVVQLTPQAASGGEPRVQQLVRAGGGLAARRSAFAGGLYLVELDAKDSVEAAVARFRGMPDVEYAIPNGIARAFFTPNDPEFGPLQWNMRLLSMERGWDLQKGNASVVVAVLDSGVAFEDYLDPSGILFRRAPDWGSTGFVEGYDAVYGRGPHANDVDGHGTHVASTVAEGTNNAFGVAGVAFGCSLMPVRVLGVGGEGSLFDIANGIDYAVSFTRDGRRPVKVINMSLGGPAELEAIGEPVRRAVDRAVAAGVVVVVAAGNENGPVAFPALLPNVIAVGAVDPRKRRAPYSNFGRELDVVAPGGDMSLSSLDGIWQQTYAGTNIGDPQIDRFEVVPLEGTSMAAPHVAAMAALLFSQGFSDPLQVRAAIEGTAEDLGPSGFDAQYGHGLIRPVEGLKGLGLTR